MTDAKPYPKSSQLARDWTPFRARAHEWATLRRQKMGPCRVCSKRYPEPDLHHVVRRGHGGDDWPDNLVPLCRDCHAAAHNRSETVGRLLLSRLSGAEYAYMVERGGEDYPERAYGIRYQR